MSSPNRPHNTSQPPGAPKPPGTARTVRRLLLASIGMFAFGFLLVPLYDVFCEITGLNGKTSAKAYAIEDGLQVDKSRWVTVQFLTNKNAGMNWEFEATERKVRVHPGELRKVSFTVVNPTTQRMSAQAVPSVSPSEGAEYLLKTQCFCFQQQELNGGANQQMTLLFRVDPNLPAHISTLTLAYTLFDISDSTDGAQALAGYSSGAYTLY